MTQPNSEGRRVAVTGMGLVSCLGLDLADAARALREGRSGVAISAERKAAGFRSALCGALPAFDPAEFLSKKERKNMGEHVQFAAIAAIKAMQDWGGDPALLESDRAGIIIGNDSSAGCATAVLDVTRGEGATAGLGSGAVVRCMNSSPTINLGVRYKVRGASLTLSAGDASASHAIGAAWLLIKAGMVDRMITGGCQELCWEGSAPFDAYGAYTAREGDPAAASRPFDRDRDGIVPGGGAAILILEEMESARARGAKIHGEIAGCQFAADGRDAAALSPAAAIRCMRGALDQAGAAAGDIDLVCASASGSREADAAEAVAICEVFGSPGPPVCSTKALTGSEGWMAGASQAIYSLLMMREGFIAPNINFGGFSEGMPEIDVVRATREADIATVLVNTFGHFGSDASLLLRAARREGSL